MGYCPVFSIITPSFNQGEFLAETIESVISQEGDFGIDYLIADGGSTDDSVEIIRRYDELLQRGAWPIRCKGIRLRWSSEQDDGQADALSKGFRMAEGSLFAWLNSDDTYLPGTLQTVADYFRDHPDIGLIYGNASYRDAAGVTIGGYKTEEFDLERLASTNIICQPAAFFRRAAYEKAEGIDCSLRFVMDYDLWIRIARQGGCSYIPEPLATYRLHGASKTVNDTTLVDNSEEGLHVTMRHYGWAPFTRIYTDSHIRCRAGLPPLLAENRAVCTLLALSWSLCRSLRLNRGIDRRDMGLCNWNNVRKLFRTRLEIMTGRREP